MKKYSEDNVNCIEIGTNSYLYTFLTEQVDIEVLNIKESSRGLQGELTISHPLDTSILSHITYQFYSASGRKSLERQLAQIYTEVLVPWDDILEYLTDDIYSKWHQPLEVIDINDAPETEQLEYLVNPILLLGQPTTIFSAGGVGKSLIADLVAFITTEGLATSFGLIASQGPANVLYLDWEGDHNTHKRYIKAIRDGFEKAGAILSLEHKTIFYIHCDKSLSAYVSELPEIIKQKDIRLVIIDSQMAATSDSKQGQSEAQVAGEYYNDLRSLNVTTITIDHTSKAAMQIDDPKATPWGTVVKYNRSRSQYELKMDDSFEDSDHKEYILVHTKHNLTHKQKPLAFSVDFVNEGDLLKSITFSPCDITENPELSKKGLTKVQRLVNALKKRPGNIGTISELAADIEESDNEDAVGATLARSKNIFIKLGTGKYGLVLKG